MFNTMCDETLYDKFSVSNLVSFILGVQQTSVQEQQEIWRWQVIQFPSIIYMLH